MEFPAGSEVVFHLDGPDGPVMYGGIVKYASHPPTERVVLVTSRKGEEIETYSLPVRVERLERM